MAVACPYSTCQVASFPGCLQLGEGLRVGVSKHWTVITCLASYLNPFSFLCVGENLGYAGQACL